MGVRLRGVLMGQLGELRYEPIEKRIRAWLGAGTVVDSTRAALVWEPRRIVPSYAVPVADVDGELVDAPGDAAEAPEGVRMMEWPAVLDPSVPFAVHTTPGRSLTVRANGSELAGAAFAPDDPELAGSVILEFEAFDAWYEEDERNVGHPRDPFHRIDIVHGSRTVRVERDGEVLAQSTRPYLLFEPPLPTRYYLPAADVRMDLLRPSDTTTTCAYKGHASYWSLADEDDVAWTYQAPLREAAEITDLIAFFNERVDIVVDGVRLERPATPWSRGARA
jgi:uncharacterized protein (DUF427 family)